MEKNLVHVNNVKLCNSLIVTLLVKFSLIILAVSIEYNEYNVVYVSLVLS